ncbi:leucine-, glutamate- and lysine-rich protein 1-like [Pomacea canaliculata]|uniref:leucine-, glutamate- and lysine-rich protein 1-like n=1 Tax=Pomacea canaliculata TaxID=400727 RepID=UPI000D72D3D4|nr:leucine-, glutamate- and lysine-rich protein 1-like [Pomacea canaliculata]
MEEPNVGKASFERYTPKYPLPEEIRKMKRDDTICQYCGVSYLIHAEIKALEEKLLAIEKELTFYKGKEDRESLLIKEKEELLQYKQDQEKTLLAKDNMLATLKQELKKSSEDNSSLVNKIQASAENENKYREQYLTALRQLSVLKSFVQKQKDDVNLTRKNVIELKEAATDQVLFAKEKLKDICKGFQKDFDDLQSRLQCLEMEHMVTSQSNKTLTEKLQQQEEKMKVLEKCKQEMLTLDNRSKELCTCIQEMQTKLDEAESQNRRLQMEADQYQRQIRTKTEEVEEAIRQKQQQVKNNEMAVKELQECIQNKDGEITNLQKRLKNLENLHLEAERWKADIEQQNISTAHEAKELKESLIRALKDAEALKAEREMMISAHQSRIEDLRESFKRKMAQQENSQEKIQTALEEEKHKHQAELASLEAKLKESFVLEVQIEKQKYEELLQKYQTERTSQKMAEITELEARHQREAQGFEQRFAETKRQAEVRETELRREIESLKKIIAELQDRLGRFQSRGEEKVEELQRQLVEVQGDLRTWREKAEVLESSLQQSREEVQFLQDTVRKECEERFELTEALSEARRELLSFKKPAGGYIPSGTPRNTAHVPDNGLAPLRRSTSVSSFQSSLSSASVAEDINKPRPPPVPPNNVNVSFNGEARKSSRQMLGASIADNRRRIAALLGKLSP